MGGWERETGACLDVGARDSSIIATCSYTWNGSIAFFPITLLKCLILDVWLTLPPRTQLKETNFVRRNGCGSISYFMKGAWPAKIHSGGLVWPCAMPVQGIIPLCTPPFASEGAHLGPAHTPPVNLFINFQYFGISGP